METKQQPKEAPKQVRKGPAFCLRLNTFRALSCLSVIITHIVSFSGLIDEFQTFHFAGHQAVYFFFNLSGYLLSLSLVKEVKRRVSAHKQTPVAEDEERRLVSNQSGQLELENEQTVGYQTHAPPPSGGFSLIGGIKQVQKSLLACIVSKYLWNRTWKTFPMYFGAWLILHGVSHPDTKVESLDPNITWGQIFGLKVFPGHLWTMRIDMIFYFYVVPIYVCCLYAAFKLQKAGYKLLSKLAFGAIVVALLVTAIYNMVSAEQVFHPFALEDYFFPCLPPFCFGMLAGLINFALEKRITARQAANTQEPREAIEEQDDSLVGKVKSWATRNLYTIIFTFIFLRIVFLNPGIWGNTHAKSPIAPLQVANLHSYWYGLFILINDTRGGFWKYMHPNEAKQTTLHPSSLHKVIYYFGLWSYAIYLTHPVSYDTLKRLMPAKSFHTTEFWTGSILLAFGLGIIVDYVFDKVLTDKIIQGMIFKNIGKVISKKQKEHEAAKVSTP